VLTGVFGEGELGPVRQPRQTALHKAAEDGNLELARTLLRLGADPDIRDHRFDSTPLGWARPVPAARRAARRGPGGQPSAPPSPYPHHPPPRQALANQ
jgi:hypothetical protein